MVVVFTEVSDDGLIGDDVAHGALSADFVAVYAAELTPITRVAYLVVRDRAVAEEIAQEAFIRLFDHFADVRNPTGFLRTAAARLAINRQKRRSMERDRLGLVAVHRRAESDAAATDGFVIDEVWDALGRLKPERAAVLILRFYEDLPFSEIAEILGASPATVRSRNRRALADLRKELKP